MKEKKGQQARILNRLEWDERLWLEYGVPFENIPYKEIASLVQEGFSLDILNQAFDLVEKEKDEGRPGAFVVSEYDGDYNMVYKVYGWQE